MNKGILSGIGAYVLWGLFPIYWKFLHHVPAVQIIGHRIVWVALIIFGIESYRAGRVVKNRIETLS